MTTKCPSGVALFHDFKIYSCVMFNFQPQMSSDSAPHKFSDSLPGMLDFFSTFTKCSTAFNVAVSIPIYLSVCAFLISARHKPPFNSSFYTLFIALGFADISKYLLYVLKKCSYWGWIPQLFHPLDEPNTAARLLYFLLWTLSFAQNLLNLLLSLNRFVSICLPRLFVHWSKQCTQAMLLLVGACSVCLCAPILWEPVCFRSTLILLGNGSQQMMTKITGPVFMHTSTLITYYNITKLFAIVNLCFCLFGYPAMFRRIRRVNMKDRAQALEVRMLYALVLLASANILYACYLTTWSLLSRTHPHLAPVAEWSLYVIVDFYDMNAPYALLITSRMIRAATLPRCCLCPGGNRSTRERRSTDAILRGASANALAGGWKTSSPNASSSLRVVEWRRP